MSPISDILFLQFISEIFDFWGRMCMHFFTLDFLPFFCKFNCSLKGTENHTLAQCSDETPNDFQHLIYGRSLSYTGACVKTGQR